MHRHKYILLMIFAFITTIAGITGIMWDRFDKLTSKDFALAQNQNAQTNTSEIIDCQTINKDGLIMYVKNGNLYSSDFTGSCKATLRSTGRVLAVSRSRNGQLIAFTELPETQIKNKQAINLFILNIETRQITQINKKPVDQSVMYWSPDNRFIVYKEDGLLTLYFNYLLEYVTLQESAEKIYITATNRIILFKDNLLNDKANIMIYDNNGNLIESLPFDYTGETYTPLYWNATKKTLLGYTENKEQIITGFMKDGVENYPLKPYGVTSCKNDPAGELNPFPQGICGATGASLTTNLSHLLIAKNNPLNENRARILLYDLKRNTYKEISGFNNVSKVYKIKWNTYNSVFVLNTLPDADGTRYLYAYNINRQTLYPLDSLASSEETTSSDISQFNFSTGYDY